MCGIGGFVGTGLSEIDLLTTIEEVCHSLKHRGPDDQGHFLAQGVVLGMTRLAIRDPMHGKQPMTRQGVSLVFNGEIYNTQQLQQEMELEKWTTTSDTEVVLAGYIHYGPEIFNKLGGMFALALWDDRKKTLFLARDRWGEKPLYYVNSVQGIAFASEVVGLRPWKHIDWEIEISDILAFLKQSYVPTPHTGWRNILKLKPGCYLKWQNGVMEIHRYHYPQVSFKTQTTRELEDLLDSCIQKCSISDRPIGAFLSGGLDSSTVVTYLHKFISNFPVYSIDWEDKSYSEISYSTLLSKTLGLAHHVIKCQPEFMIDNFEHIVALYGEPFGDESMIPTYCLAKRAKEDVDVVLTGDGADEFFHGYERYFFDRDPACYEEVFSPMDNATRNLIYGEELKYHAPTSRLCFEDEWKVSPVATLRVRSLSDIQNYLTDDILMKVDRATMAVGLEARAPFLMPELTAFALSSPLNALTENGKRGKKILREASKKRVPNFIRNRKKQGFGVPLGNWFSNELNHWMKERLLSGILPKLGWFSLRGLEALSEAPTRYSRALFNLLVLEVWYRKNKY